MLAFFSQPYPDELLYSTFARYHLWSGNMSPKRTTQELFGKPTITATLDLPVDVASLLDRIPRCKYNIEDWIHNHTLFNYYAAFLFADQKSKVYEAMKNSQKGVVHFTTGLMASKVQTWKHLRFCTKCVKDDKDKYGEAYWHRVHQLPGVFVCPHHLEWVHSSKFLVQQYNKHEFVFPKLEECMVLEKIPNILIKNQEVLIQIAQDSFNLLNQSPFEVNIDSLINTYKRALAAKKLVKPSGYVDQKDLSKQFVDYFGEELLFYLQSSINIESESSWLKEIVRKHRKAFHPLRHLLLLLFLGESVDVLSNLPHSYSLFPFKPYPCMNPTCVYHKQRVIWDVKISRCSKTRRPIGTFACSCGFIYARKGPDLKESDIFNKVRVKEFGSVWENTLKEEIKRTDYSFRSIAKKLKADPKTVKRYLDKIKTDESRKQINQLSKGDNTELVEMKRGDWLALLKQNPCLSKTEIRKLNPSLYTWLYRHDKGWLLDQKVKLGNKKKITSKVDWQERDERICKEVRKKIIEYTLKDTKPVRITLSRIGKEVGCLGLLEKHLEKLPKTKSVILKHQESIEQYQMRRISWAAKKLYRDNEELKEWKVIKVAGLKSDCNKEILQEIKRQISIYKDISMGKEISL